MKRLCLALTYLSWFVVVTFAQENSTDRLRRAQALSRGCSAEFDDPSTQEFRDCTQAIRLYEEIVKERRSGARQLLVLAQLYANRSDEKAIELYRRMLVSNPDEPTANFELATLLPSGSDRIVHLRAVIRAQPNHSEAHGLLARELIKQRATVPEAVQEIQRQTTIKPSVEAVVDVIEALKRQGNRLLQEDDVEKAVGEITAQIAMNPLVSRNDVFKFASELPSRGLVDRASQVYLAYLESSSGSREAICDSMRQVLDRLDARFGSVRQTFQQLCR